MNSQLIVLEGLERAWQWLKATLAEEVRYRLALAELNQLDDRDLDDLNLGRIDLPVLARRHARQAQ